MTCTLMFRWPTHAELTTFVVLTPALAAPAGAPIPDKLLGGGRTDQVSIRSAHEVGSITLLKKGKFVHLGLTDWAGE